MPNSEEKLTRALAVMVLDPKIRAFLERNDPKALAQAESALEAVNFQLPRPEKKDPGTFVPTQEDMDLLAEKLTNAEVFENHGRGVQCVKAIVTYLKRGDFASAQAVKLNEHDKIRNYPKIDAIFKEFWARNPRGSIGSLDV